MNLEKNFGGQISKENDEHVSKSNTDLLDKMMKIIMKSNVWRFNKKKQAKIQENTYSCKLGEEQ